MPINRDLVNAQVSGQMVQIASGPMVQIASGLFVNVQSGIFVNVGTALSGLDIQVNISGDPVVVSSGVIDINLVNSSGLQVITQPGIQVSGAVQISGTITVDPVTSSGLFVKNVMIDTAGDEAKIDATAQALETIEYEHHEIHEGEMFHAHEQISGLADNGTLDLLVVTGSGIEVHAMFEYGSEGAAWFELYEGVLLSGSPGGSGTPATAWCMNRYVSGTPASTVFKDPSVVVGDKIDVVYMPGGEGPKTAGAGGRGANEWILTGVSGPENYLARIINVGGAPKDANLAVEFYEKTPGYHGTP